MVADLALAQIERGTRTTVFMPDEGEDWLGAQLKGSEVSIERYALGGPLSPRCAVQLTTAFRRRGITLAHSHDFTMAVSGALSARVAGIPHVITMHGGRYYAERLRRRVVLRLAISSSRTTCAVSAKLAQQLRDDLGLTNGRISIIPNGVAPHAPVDSTLRRELALPDRVPILVSVGNLYEVKGHRFLLEALAQIRTDAHLVIAGRGDCEAELRQLADRLGLSTRLHLFGLRSDIPNLLAGADVFVLPSLAEGLPVALLEAMLAGCPIVASDVGDVHRAVGEEGALLAAPGDAAGLAVAIERLLLQPHLARALGAIARARASATYGLGAMVDRYAALYTTRARRTGR